MELARSIEYIVGDTVGPGLVGPFIRSLGRELRVRDPARTARRGALVTSAEAAQLEFDAALWERSHSAMRAARVKLQNFVLHRLADLVGPDRVGEFVETYLHFRRWDREPRLFEGQVIN